MTHMDAEEGEVLEDGEIEDEPVETQSTTAETPPKSSGKSRNRSSKKAEAAGDITDFINRKRKELEDRVKNQLRIAGVNAKVIGGVGSEDEESNTEQKAPRKRHASSDEKTPSKRSKKSSATYYDLDGKVLVEDPTAAMLASWTKPKSTKRNKSFDEEETGTLEDYYGVESAEAQLQQQESRLQQQQQQPSAFGDVDYRKYNGETAAGSSGYYSYSPSESPTDTGRPASNEFGDVDERGTGTESDERFDRHERRGRRGSNYDRYERSSKRYSNEESSGNFDDSSDAGGRWGAGRRGSGRLGGGRGRGRGGGGGAGGAGRFFEDRQSNRSEGATAETNGGRKWTEKPPCKFYREGFCREGENCSYSHDVEQMKKEKKPDLCRYYMNGFCRNGDECPFMHEEFPCKFFHKGECEKGIECRYSHAPLTDITRLLFEEMLRDDEIYGNKMKKTPEKKVPEHPANGPADQPIGPGGPVSKRKCLLGAPPPPQPPMDQMGPPGPGNWGPPPPGPGPGPFGGPWMGPPGPWDQGMQHPQGAPGAPFFGGPPMGDHQTLGGPGGPPMAPPNDQQAPNFAPTDNIAIPSGLPESQHDLYRKIQTQQQQRQQQQLQQQISPKDRGSPVQERTAATDSSSGAGGGAAAGDSPKTGSYDVSALLRQIRQKVKGDDADVDESPAEPMDYGASEANAKPLKEIPLDHQRRPKYKLIPVDIPAKIDEISPTFLQASLADPKLRNDPRLKKRLATQFDAVSNLITSQGQGTTQKRDDPQPNAIVPALAGPRSRDPRLAKSGPASSPPNSTSPPLQPQISSGPIQMPNSGPYLINPQQSQGMLGGPLMGPPQAAFMGPPTMMMGGGMPTGPGGWMPQMPTANASMPELAPFQPPAANLGMPPHTVDFMGNYGAAGGLEPAKDPRRARQSRWGVQTVPSPQQVAQSPPEIFGGGGGPEASPKHQPMSLREKRKNLQYDSPLSR